MRQQRGVSSILAAAALGCAMLACAAAVPAPGPASAQTAVQDDIERLLSADHAAALEGMGAPIDGQHLRRWYESRGYRPLWSVAGRPTASALSLLHELDNAADRGLDPQDYHAASLAALATEAAAGAPAAGAAAPGVTPWALFDAQLSLVAIRFVSELHYGRIDPASVGHNLTVERLQLDVPAAVVALSAAVDVPAALDSLEPQFLHYALLKNQLRRYRRLAAAPPQSALPPLPAKSLRAGAVYAGTAQLQRLLQALGDLPGAATDDTVLSPPVVAALKHFQSRHGETPDGVLGAGTFKELVTPLDRRVRQIVLTMERWRWLPAKLPTAPIIVNIPQFRLFAFESTTDSEATIRQMDVIVGKAFHATETPVFTADMKYLVFRPYWEVPLDIARREIVPAARRDPASIARHQMEIVRGGGDAAVVLPVTAENIDLLAKGVLRVRQKPGPDNSLGLVKFIFPNPYDVYLHSTPAKSLFAEPRRDFSHGCIRVGDPVGLAEYVLRDSPQWTPAAILAAMNGAGPLTVRLKNPIRVFIVYGTALATENGDVLFFDDIYGHDRRLEEALDARRAAHPGA